MTKLLIGLIVESILFMFLSKRFIIDNNDKKNSLIAFVILIFFNFSISLQYTQEIIGEVNLFYVPSIFVAIMALLLSVMNKNTLQFRKEYIFVIIFIFHYIYTWMINHKIDQASYFYMILLLLSILFIILIYQSLDEINLNSIIYSVNYLAIANGILAMLQYLTGKKLVPGSFNQSIIYSEGLVSVKRAVGIAVTNNAAGNLGALLFAVILYNVISRKDAISVVSLIFTSVFSILSLTRIGYLGIVVEILVYCLILYRNQLIKQLKKIKIIIAITAVLLITLLLLWNKMYYYLFQSRGDTLTSRFVQYQRIFKEVIMNNLLLGIGEGQYRYYMATKLKILDIDIHSQYLNILVEQGLILFAIFIFVNFYMIFYVVRYSQSIQLKALTLALFIGNFICVNFNPNQYYYINNIVYYFILL
uniref:O-antigen ligase family protein n=1 Tax=Sporolactobacillus terrae TaxID=269673 RepID=UPI00048D6BCC